MLEIHITENDGVYGKLNNILSRHIPFPFEITKTDKGKPYIEGNPLFFSLSHSGGKALIVLCDKPVGADIEIITDKKHTAVLSAMCNEEKREINCAEHFLTHWVVREAYIKMLGSTLAEKLKHLKFVQGKLYDGELQPECEIITQTDGDCVYAVCIDK